MEINNNNSVTIEKELIWLSKVIEARFQNYFDNQKSADIFLILPPELDSDESVYAKLIRHYGLSFSERLLIILSLAPNIKPQILDVFFLKNKQTERGYTEFGGMKGKGHGGFIPTGETASFILAGGNIEIKIELLKLFNPGHVFYKHGLLRLGENSDNEPMLSGILQISEDCIDLLTIGHARKPSFSSKFPASLVETSMGWDDLVLDAHSKTQVDNILSWIEHQEMIMDEWNLKNLLKPGYRALFYGPPGTGKTLTAGLLGKYAEKDVYKIDVSMVTSKWVGETEKNLARVFDMAENKNWILFFDEADSLFGKRTDAASSQDRYANQEVSYLLQRTEEYPGVVILASNLKGNIDQAFTRRFQSIIQFKMPDTRERIQLWESSFNGFLELDADVDLSAVARSYEISGGSIMNVLKYCATTCARIGSKKVSQNQIINGIKHELMKEGKTV